MSAPLGKQLYFDGERYFLVPDEEPTPTRGHEAWTVAGDERRLSPQQVEAYAVSEADAEAFIALEIDDVLTRFMPVFIEMFAVLAEQSDPDEVQALLAGVEHTLAAVTTGDVAAIERFRERADRVSGVLASRGRQHMADIVRQLPDTMTEVLGRRRRDG